MKHFQIRQKCLKTRARAGRLNTRRGEIKTPVFMPVGTLGTVKSLCPEDIFFTGARIILGNTYHLYLRPGCDVIESFPGLHPFMNWSGAILTDSGGFQVFSLAKLTRVSDQAVEFQSHIDGSTHVLSPETSVDIQISLGSDILMCLDHLVEYPIEREKAKDAVKRTAAWAKRSRDRFTVRTASVPETYRSMLFGIQQGGMEKDLRERSTNDLLFVDFDGYAVGGLSVGEPKEVMMETAAHSIPLLPEDKPRYVMGVGTPCDIVSMVEMGADMFDCVLPTRNARNGQLFTRYGKINIANSRYRKDIGPPEEGCDCYTCRNFSLAYLRHLYLSKELLVYRLNTIHNIRFYMRLMEQMRKAIIENRFPEFKTKFFREYQSTEEETIADL